MALGGEGSCIASGGEPYQQLDSVDDQSQVTSQQDVKPVSIQRLTTVSPDKPFLASPWEAMFSTDMGQRPWRARRAFVAPVIRENPTEDAEEMARTYEEKYRKQCRYIGLSYTSVEAYWDEYDIQLFGRNFLQQVLLTIDRHNTTRTQSMVDDNATKWRKKNPNLWDSLDLSWTMRQAFGEKFLDNLVKSTEQELARKVFDRLKEWKFPEGK